MKIGAIVIFILVSITIMNCENPASTPTTNTVLVYDTLKVLDTVIFYDTVTHYDTQFVVADLYLSGEKSNKIGAPVIIKVTTSPTGILSKGGIEISWQPLTGAIGYRVYLRTSLDNETFYLTGHPGYSDNSEPPFYYQNIYPSALTALPQMYRLWVVGIDEDGLFGEPSATQNVYWPGQ